MMINGNFSLGKLNGYLEIKMAGDILDNQVAMID